MIDINISDEQIDLFDDVLEANEEIIEDIEPFEPSNIVVFSRDWTVETIYQQISEGNIELEPKFQRRNAWNDEKRSKLIESIIIGYPIPEIVLAEDPERKRSFIVIDGKQRLLTVAGFINPTKYNYWTKNHLIDLDVRRDLNGVSYEDFSKDSKWANEFREFRNSSFRCTVIANFDKNDVLYDIFYRLNSGATPLSTQELRQVLNKGDFADYLMAITNEVQPIHKVLNLTEPDKRLRDIEIILRCLSIIMYGSEYTGNLKKFLDEKMGAINKEWRTIEPNVTQLYERINKSIEILKSIFGNYRAIGKRYSGGKIDSRFNRVLFEVEIFYFIHISEEQVTEETKRSFLTNFQSLCESDYEFRASIESSTKNIKNYRIRFSKFEELVNNSFNLNLDINPVPSE